MGVVFTTILKQHVKQPQAQKALGSLEGKKKGANQNPIITRKEKYSNKKGRGYIILDLWGL